MSALTDHAEIVAATEAAERRGYLLCARPFLAWLEDQYAAIYALLGLPLPPQVQWSRARTPWIDPVVQPGDDAFLDAVARHERPAAASADDWDRVLDEDARLRALFDAWPLGQLRKQDFQLGQRPLQRLAHRIGRRIRAAFQGAQRQVPQSVEREQRIGRLGADDRADRQRQALEASGHPGRLKLRFAEALQAPLDLRQPFFDIHSDLPRVSRKAAEDPRVQAFRVGPGRAATAPPPVASSLEHGRRRGHPIDGRSAGPPAASPIRSRPVGWGTP